MRCAIAGLVLMCAAYASAQRLVVKIVNRQNNETDYTYVVPGSFSSQSNSNANCYWKRRQCELQWDHHNNWFEYACPAGLISRARTTFTLQLPDGRAVVVNCESKFKERMAGPRGNPQELPYSRSLMKLTLTFMGIMPSWSGWSASTERSCSRRRTRF